MQPQQHRDQMHDGGELNVNTMCANGLLRIQDILRPNGPSGHLGHPGMMNPPHHSLHPHHHHHLAHHLQHNGGVPNFGGLNMKGSPISPPIGPDQSPPATPPMHSPDSYKGSKNRDDSFKGSPDSGKGNQDSVNLNLCITPQLTAYFTS